MGKTVRFAAPLLLVVLASAGGARAQEQKFADPGDFRLEGGEVIRDCRVGYRTFGRLRITVEIMRGAGFGREIMG